MCQLTGIMYSMSPRLGGGDRGSLPAYAAHYPMALHCFAGRTQGRRPPRPVVQLQYSTCTVLSRKYGVSI